jgi:hypothetical protein
MDVAFVIRQRLAVLGREQRDLVRAAEVTKSYIQRLKFKGKRPTALYYYREWQTSAIPCIFARHSRRTGASALSRTPRWHHDQKSQQRLGISSATF